MYDPKAAERQHQVESFPQAEFKDGAWRWKSNGQVPFPDMLGTWVAEGFITLQQAFTSTAAREADLSEFLAEYRASQQAEPSAEERFEARAAHGPGVTLTNVITGRKWTT